MKKNLLLAFFMLCAYVSSINAQDNVLSNGDFESTFEVVSGSSEGNGGNDWLYVGWGTVEFTIEAETAEPINGSASAKATITSIDASNWTKIQFGKNPVPLVEGLHYFKMNYKANKPGTVKLSWELNEEPWTKFILDSVNLETGEGKSWKTELDVLNDHVTEKGQFKLFFGMEENVGLELILDDLYLGPTDPDAEPESVFNSSIAAFKMYPNPANNMVTLENVELGANISVINLAGQEVINLVSDNSKVNINIADLVSGVYFVKVNDSALKLIVD